MKEFRITTAQPGAQELASIIRYHLHLSKEQEVLIGAVIQSYVDAGLLKGKVVIGDHIEDNETVLDWYEL